ncbi:transcriptional regulator NrdR [Pararobbsia silviterrae]|uniref:Transcriptional repressor NrdR n=1 Tax=Pararobbsia silviterrae TaxID=1792498 RepID=A0A494Y8B1_9BURK|nr:transcriptional regulator NrdR [Pararobbsia silviterrae]RKP56546.1 transcriptional repressor NrdR [Pararobbsia silviterrae]
MRCPFCRHEDTQVVDSRVSEDGAAIRRRRRCPECDKRFTTYERVELAMPVVVKKDGSRVEFDRTKLAASLQLALRKRPVSAESVADAVARIEYQLLGSGEREIGSSQLGELVMNELRRLDKIAYVRFASVYRRFEDVAEFQDLLQEIRNSGPQRPPRKRQDKNGVS